MPYLPLPTTDGAPEGGPVTVGENLDRLLGRWGGPTRRTVSGMAGRWREMVGDALAEHTRPVRVRDGTLIIAVDDPAWATQVRWLGEDLAARARTVLNDDSIVGIEVRIGAEDHRDAPSG